MKRFIKYILCSAVLLFYPCVHGLNDSDAQWVVSDPTQTATNLSSFLEQIANGLEQLGISEGHLQAFNTTKAWLDEIHGSEAMRKISGFLNTLGLFDKLYRNIERTVGLVESMYSSIEGLVSYGYSTAMVNRLMTYMLITINQLGTVKDDIMAIMNAAGLTFGEKVRLASEALDNSFVILDNTSAQVTAEIQGLENMRTMLAFTNWLEDRPASDGLGGVGGGAGDVDPLDKVDEGDVTHEDTVRENGLTVKVYKFAVLIIGLLCVIGLAVALGRYYQGTPGAEMMFVRILAAGFGSFIVLWVLSKVFNLGGF